MILSPGSGEQHFAKRTSMPLSPFTITPLEDVPVSAMSGRALKDGTFLFNVSLVIKNTQQLAKIIRDLRKWSDIIEVNRVSG